MKFFSIQAKNFFLLICALGVSAFTIAPAHAGNWEFVRYQRNAEYNNQDLAVGGSMYSAPNGSFVITEKHRNRYLVRWRDEQEKFYVNGQERKYFYDSGPQLWWNNGRPTFNTRGKAEAQVASSTGELNITPVFRWKRQPVWDSLLRRYVDDLNDNPPKELYYVETATISGAESIRQWDGNGLNYSAQNPFGGKQFSFKYIKHPFAEGEPSHSISHSANGYGASHWFSAPEGDSRVVKIPVGDREEVAGETRAFGGQIDLNTKYTEESPWDRNGTASLSFGYTATPCHIVLNVQANAFEVFRDHPRDKHLAAYANSGLLGVSNNQAAVKAFLNGSGTYTLSISSSLLDTIGKPSYQWNSSSRRYHSQQFANGLDPSLWTGQPDPKELIGTSTMEKQLNHDLEKGDTDSARTTVNVKITGSNPKKSQLTAKAKIDWYRRPYTKFRAEVETEVCDHNTGACTPIEQVMQGNQNPLTTEEEKTVDTFTADYEAMKKEFITTGATYVGLALEAEMMVGSWFVPDEVDLATGGLTLLGKPLRATYKVAKTFKAVVTVGARINRVRDKLSAMVPAVRKSLGHSNFSIVMKRKKFREARGGHVGPNGKREEAVMGEVKEEEEILCSIPGGTCFVKGTLVATQRGLRAIETLQKDDLVWSKSETTGTIELRPIEQTFERHSATLVLTFSNGEVIETTREHPFYVESQGFKAAGDLGIGTSIVTRAGPSVTLASTSLGEAQTVYNLKIKEFHTYFVGSSELWVHNADYPEWQKGDSITKMMPDGTYPIWKIIRERYWKNRDAAGFSPANVGRMASGKPPIARVHVRWRTSGAGHAAGDEQVITATLELHHDLGGRGTQGSDEPVHLREVWPWQHDVVDPSRHTGYDFLGFAGGD